MKALTKNWTVVDRRESFFIISLGCFLITVCSLVKIPFFPISFTLQTLAIYFIALTQTPKNAFLSVICYLGCATVGLPVLCGHSNCFWILGKSAGYLIAFPIATYLIAKIAEKRHPLIAIVSGQVVIFALGFLWLIPFFGLSTAGMKGVVLFIPSELLKGLIVFAATRKWNEVE